MPETLIMIARIAIQRQNLTYEQMRDTADVREKRELHSQAEKAEGIYLNGNTRPASSKLTR